MSHAEKVSLQDICEIILIKADGRKITPEMLIPVLTEDFLKNLVEELENERKSNKKSSQTM